MDDWNTKLLLAAMEGREEDTKLCIENGSNINYKEDGKTALMLAASGGHLEVCQLVLDRGCEKDATTGTGLTALMLAAMEGNLDVCQLLLDFGCEKDLTDKNGRTVLMFAAMWGHLEVCQLIIDSGCKIDTTNDQDRTALMFAAYDGYLDVCQLILYSGCEIDTTNMFGETALMMAAKRGHLELFRLIHDFEREKDTTSTMTNDKSGRTVLHGAAENGNIQITRYILEQVGISPLVKTYKGKTPCDLAAAKLKDNPDSPRRKEVMEYLQSVMSSDGQYDSLKTSGKEQETPTVEDDIVPTEIKLMADKRSVPLYLKLLESGSEKKRDIRLVFVGKKGAGKTSLIKRLFSEENTIDVTSTNGIEIHTIKCKAISDDGIWNKLDGTDKGTETHARLLKHYKGTIDASVEDGTHEAVKDNTLITVLYRRIEESKESDTVSQQPEILKPPVDIESTVKSSVATEATVKLPVTNPNQSIEQAKRDIKHMLKSNVDLLDKEAYATLLLWDFAGDEEFYHTHQTFLSPDAIYLVVTKLNEADDKKAQDLFRLWMDSIHCYCRLDVVKSTFDDNKITSGNLDPPVVIVGTWKDGVISEEEEVEDACRKQILTYTENMSNDERGHIRCEFLISNTEDDNTVFQKIRQYIVSLAKAMRTWNIEYPLKFIELEQRLQEKTKELPIISYQEIKHISSEMKNPLNDDELMLYLMFHHEIRALVYFKDLPDYIILDTQWLSDAFKCIVTAEKFRACSIKNQEQWKEFLSRGKLHWEVVEDIFKLEQDILYKHKDHVLNVMEKFDIIIRPNISDRDNADAKPCYYVPCIIKEEPVCDIYEMFNVTKDICKKSTWLYFKFRFLPPHLIHHLIASLSRKYEVAEVVTKQKKKQIALFRGFAVFELQKTTKLRKLLVMKCPNAIQIQIWQFGKLVERGLFKYIADFVTEEIIKIITTRFKMSNVKFEKKWECGQSQ